MLKYQRLNREERDVIYMGHLHGATITSLAKRLGRCPSTIYRELKRNSCNNHYNPNGAHDAAQSRRSRNRPRLILNDTLHEYVVAKLKDGWSPESIAGRLNLDQAHKQVSAETIYAFIYSSEGQRQGLYRHLARKHVKRRFKFGRKKNRRSIIKDLVPIEQRPESVTKRERVGDFEVDLVFFSGSQSKNVITAVDRKSRFIFLSLAKSKRPQIVNRAIIRALGSLPKQARQTGTFDRGVEFAQHIILGKALGLKTYFCKPHSPWQKGQVENSNGRLRRFLPFATNIKNISKGLLDAVQNKLNNQPRKCLGFRTPAEVFGRELAQLNGGYCCG